MRHGDSWAGAFALGMGLFTDVLSAAPLGLFSVIHLIVFLGIKAGDGVFDLQSIKGQLIVVFAAVMLKKLLLMGLLNLFSLSASPEVRILSAFLFSAVLTTGFAPAVFLGLDKVGKLLSVARAEPEDPQPS